MSNFNFEDDVTALERDGMKRILRPRDADASLINFSSNDYLGLSHHPSVVAAAQAAVAKFGVGAAASRLLAGTTSAHETLENSLAAFFNKEAALVFSSGFHTNSGVLPVLAEAGDIIFVDRLAHASILDGVRLSHARFSTFEHNDVDDLGAQLAKKRSSYRRAFIVTEGIFSMDGDRPPLSELVALSKRYDAYLYLDEAHSVGVYGKNGRGIAEEGGHLADVDIFVSTLSKTLGSQGGFVAGKKSLIELLISKSRSFIYTTALAPVCAAAAQAALDLFPSMNDRRRRVLEASRDVRVDLERLGYSVLPGMSQIIPVWTGDVAGTRALSTHLLSNGFFVPSIRPPTVPQGESRVRLSVTYDVIEKRKELVQAFASYALRPQRIKEKIGQTN